MEEVKFSEKATKDHCSLHIKCIVSLTSLVLKSVQRESDEYIQLGRIS